MRGRAQSVVGGGSRVVVIAPHCSEYIPRCIRSHIGLSDEEMRVGVDLGTSEIVARCGSFERVWGSINRLILDLNRGHHDFSEDGIFRTYDFFGRRIYRGGFCLSRSLRGRLLLEHYHPFHRHLSRLLKSAAPVFFFDIHSMDSRGGALSVTGARTRPGIIVGNFGGYAGEALASRGYSTCSLGAFRVVMRLLQEAFGGDGVSVSANGAFYGGWITERYGRPTSGRRIGGVQIEFNKNLLLDGCGRVDLEASSSVGQRLEWLLTEFRELMGEGLEIRGQRLGDERQPRGVASRPNDRGENGAG